MKLSVVIVNYNVRHFLEQCLNSVFTALNDIDAEVFVVDNNSVDGSCAMVKEKFGKVRLIANQKNLGFSAANNQAIHQAKGEYILLLNPDTVVQEDTFSQIIDFMDSHADAGGLGVKMIDGKGRFLPESKRALPTPAVAFYKIFGLSRLFPRSKRFGQYHLTYLDKDKTHKVEVLSGAFMLLRKSVIDHIGALDETYFMYGEDIDLSYRITKAGFSNYYFPGTTIIHYKGESTKKGSINYVLVFYRAMIIFARKHFSAKNAKAFSFLINSAVYFRASMAIAYRFLMRMLPALIDAALIFGIFMLIIPLWGMHKFGEPGSYPEELLRYAIPSYIITWIITLVFTGGYDRPLKIPNILKGIVIGTGIILLYYSLLPEHLRFSRALILLGASGTFLTIPLGRILLHLTKIKEFRLNITQSNKTIIIGKKDEIQRVLQLISQTGLTNRISGFVNSHEKGDDSFFLGNITQVDEIVKIHKINEVVFCARDVAAQNIISYMLMLADYKLDYKIAGPDGLTVIGSNSVHTAGDLYSITMNSIGKPENKRKKRIVDTSLSFLFLLFAPVVMWITKRPLNFVKNMFLVVFGVKSFVGYCKTADLTGLPALKPAILNPLDPSDNELDKLFAGKANILYAKDYSIIGDISLIFKSFKKLDRVSK